jgi:hypothetical protein
MFLLQLVDSNGNSRRQASGDRERGSHNNIPTISIIAECLNGIRTSKKIKKIEGETLGGKRQEKNQVSTESSDRKRFN